MRALIHHVALNVDRFDWYAGFFQRVFQMTVARTRGEAPERQLWFREGVQLNERESASECGDVCDHFSLGVDDVPAAVERAVGAGCSRLPEGAHWVALPNGVRLELKPLPEQ